MGHLLGTRWFRDLNGLIPVVGCWRWSLELSWCCQPGVSDFLYVGLLVLELPRSRGLRFNLESSSWNQEDESHMQAYQESMASCLFMSQLPKPVRCLNPLSTWKGTPQGHGTERCGLSGKNKNNSLLLGDCRSFYVSIKCIKLGRRILNVRK